MASQNVSVKEPSSGVFFIQWKLKGLQSHRIGSIECDFETGGVGTIRGPLKWKMWLQLAPGATKAHVSIRLQKGGSDGNFFAYFRLFKDELREKTCYYFGGKGVDLNQKPTLFSRSRFEVGISWASFIDLDGSEKSVTCVIELFQEGVTTDAIPYSQSQIKLSWPPSLEELNAASAVKANAAIADAVLKDEFPNTETTMISKDKKEVKVKWLVLAARSQVFAAMYKSKMSETETGVIEMNSMSGKTLEVFCHFICTGILVPAWKDEDVIVELVNAAAMYEFKELLEFFDGILDAICSKATVVQLLSLAQKLSMQSAAKGLLEWAIQYGKVSPEAFLELLEPLNDNFY